MVGPLIASNWKWSWIILIVALAATGTAAQDLQTKLAQRADFIPAAATVREQLVEVAQHYKIPMGIEWVPHAEEKQVKLDADGAPTVQALLNLILQAAPDYSLVVNDQVVNVSQTRYAVDSYNFLNLRIEEFNLTKADVYAAEAELRFKIHANLHPERYVGGMNGGYGEGFPADTGLNVKNISFAGRNLSVRNILDRIIFANGNELWLVYVVPTRMMKNELFFASFDTDQDVDFSWKIIPFKKSAQ